MSVSWTGLSIDDALSVYCSLIRSIIEYACPVWHGGLTKGQSEATDGMQSRCLKIVFPELSNKDAMQITGVELLCVRREKLVRNLFKEVKCKGHVLNNTLLIKPVDNYSFVMRDSHPYMAPKTRTDRSVRKFIFYCIRKRLAFLLL